jgi:hypothetical protein
VAEDIEAENVSCPEKWDVCHCAIGQSGENLSHGGEEMRSQTKAAKTILGV